MGRSYTSTPDGANRAPLEPIELDGEKFNASVSLLDIIPLAKLSSLDSTPNEEAGAELAQMLTGFFEVAFGSDYERFNEHVRKHRTDPMVLMRIMYDMVEDATAGLFPTMPPLPSPDGPGSTGPGSTANYSPEMWAQMQAAVQQAREQFGANVPMPPGWERPPPQTVNLPPTADPQTEAAIERIANDPQFLNRLAQNMSQREATSP